MTIFPELGGISAQSAAQWEKCWLEKGVVSVESGIFRGARGGPHLEKQYSLPRLWPDSPDADFEP